MLKLYKYVPFVTEEHGIYLLLGVSHQHCISIFALLAFV